MPESSDRFVPLAIIRHAHGVRGEVKVASLSNPPEAFLNHALHSAEGTKFKLTRTGTQPKYVICRIEGITDRTGAEAARGTTLGVMRSTLPEDADDVVFADELIGLRVINDASEEIGIIRDIVNYGASDIVVINTPTGELMLPFTHQFFPKDAENAALLCLLPEIIAGEER